MENMDEGLNVLKWVLIVGPKIPQMPNLSAQAQKFWISMRKGFIGFHSPWVAQCYFTPRSDKKILSCKQVTWGLRANSPIL